MPFLAHRSVASSLNCNPKEYCLVKCFDSAPTTHNHPPSAEISDWLIDSTSGRPPKHNLFQLYSECASLLTLQVSCHKRMVNGPNTWLLIPSAPARLWLSRQSYQVRFGLNFFFPQFNIKRMSYSILIQC